MLNTQLVIPRAISNKQYLEIETLHTPEKPQEFLQELLIASRIKPHRQSGGPDEPSQMTIGYPPHCLHNLKQASQISLPTKAKRKHKEQRQ